VKLGLYEEIRLGGVVVGDRQVLPCTSENTANSDSPVSRTRFTKTDVRGHRRNKSSSGIPRRKERSGRECGIMWLTAGQSTNESTGTPRMLRYTKNTPDERERTLQNNHIIELLVNGNSSTKNSIHTLVPPCLNHTCRCCDEW
jgi:hypothetical protein